MAQIKFEVILLPEAEGDILDIYFYISNNDSVNNAEKILSKIENACLKLNKFPKRGKMPIELTRIDVINYREVVLSPYRIIYEVMQEKVYIHAVLDSRRDLFSVLQKRLLRLG